MQRYIEIVIDSLSPEPVISRIILLGEETTPQLNAAGLLRLAGKILSNPLLKTTIAKLFAKDSGDVTVSGVVRSCYSTILEHLLRLTVQSKFDKDRE